jgi:hypothetical protein
MAVLTELTRTVGGRVRAPVAVSMAVCLLAAVGCGSTPTARGPEPGGPRSADVEVAHAFDPADKRKLVAFADNVFVGRVVGQVGQTAAQTSSPTVTLPQTQFRVVVTDNIKGRLPGAVKVNQYGGPIVLPPGAKRAKNDTHRLELWEGDPLLEPGERVLFATRRDPSRGWHVIVAQPFADVRIRSKTQANELVREFEQAHRARRVKSAPQR